MNSILDERLASFPPPDWAGQPHRRAAPRSAQVAFDDWCQELLEADRRGDRSHVNVLLGRGRAIIGSSFAAYVADEEHFAYGVDPSASVNQRRLPTR